MQTTNTLNALHTSYSGAYGADISLIIPVYDDRKIYGDCLIAERHFAYVERKASELELLSVKYVRNIYKPFDKCIKRIYHVSIVAVVTTTYSDAVTYQSPERGFLIDFLTPDCFLSYTVPQKS